MMQRISPYTYTYVYDTAEMRSYETNGVPEANWHVAWSRQARWCKLESLTPLMQVQLVASAFLKVTLNQGFHIGPIFDFA
jgi:hypothetical protein